jgi:uncharacterized membrane protein
MKNGTRFDKHSRFFPLDALRGLLIVLMALDHANFHIAQQHSSGEYWGGFFPVFETPLHFLTRFVTHICAPGFFFLMGVGMVLFQSSRRKRDWKDPEIRRHFFIRGLILIVIQLNLNGAQVWTTRGTTSPLWYVGVLAALGTGMILCIPLLNLKPVFLGAIAAGFFIVMEGLTPAPQMWGSNFDQLGGVLFVYGGGRENFWVNYPLLAWVELAVLGILFGKILLRDRKQAYRLASWFGVIFLAGYVMLRVGNGFGTIRPLAHDTWMGFLSVVKYPPSLAFTLLTMGINLLLLGLFSLLEDMTSLSWNPLLVFGRTPLFSYVVHIGIYLILGRLFVPQGTGLGVMYLYWLGGLGILYFPAYFYGTLKSQQPPQSWMRFF